MASTPSGHGYWLVASDGGIFNYGDASFYGSAGAVHLNRPVVAISVTPPVTTTPPTTTTTTSSTTTSTSTTTTTAPVGTANYLNADTQGIEGSVGGWITWFNSTLSRSTLEAKAGVASLRVDMTDQFWGAELSSPGFASIPGNKRISFWAKQGSVGSGGVIMTVYWLDSGAVGLQTDTVNIPALSASWQQATSDVVAPAGTQSVVVQFFSTDGANGKTAYLDEIYVADRP